MAEREYLNHPRKEDDGRSIEDIRQDIAKEGKNISRTVEKIGERIKEKMDWREYVRDSPYGALGVAAGLGYLASGVFKKRPTPMERIMGSIAEAGRDSLGGLLAGAAGPGLIKMILLGIAAKSAARWIKNEALKTAAGDGAGPRPQTGCGSIINQRADT